MKLITKEEAEACGLSRYFTGQPCPKGHVAERKAVNRSCVECNRLASLARNTANYQKPEYAQAARERARQWRIKNQERYNANQKRYREEKREKLRAYRKSRAAIDNAARRERRQENPEQHRQKSKERYANPAHAAKVKARAKKWREENPERYAKNNKAWRAANPDKAAAIVRAGWINRRARERNVGKISAADVKKVRATAVCAHCGQSHPKMEIDHIVALSRGGSNHLSNLQLLCRPCNRSKWAKDQVAWAKERKLKLQRN